MIVGVPGLFVTGLYAGLLTILYLGLAARVILYRRRHRVDMGTGEARLLERWVRAHANFAEYAPLGLVLLAVLESQGWSVPLLHLLGLALLVGRTAHAWSFSVEALRMRSRGAGMVLTLTALGLMALLAILAPFV